MKIYKIRYKNNPLFIKSDTYAPEAIKEIISKEKDNWYKKEKEAGYKFRELEPKDISMKYGYESFGVIDVIETDIDFDDL